MCPGLRKQGGWRAPSRCTTHPGPMLQIAPRSRLRSVSSSAHPPEYVAGLRRSGEGRPERVQRCRICGTSAGRFLSGLSGKAIRRRQGEARHVRRPRTERMSRVGWRWDHRVLDTFQNAREHIGAAFVRVRNWFYDAIDAVRRRLAGLRSVPIIAAGIAVIGFGVIAFGNEGPGSSQSPPPRPAPIVRSPVSRPPEVLIPGPSLAIDQ